MRIQLLSDLHLERHPEFVPQPAPGVDVLVLAGDIGSYQAGSRLTDDDFGLGRFSPWLEGSPWRHVLFVPGNHEFDSIEFHEATERLKNTCQRLGITWLEREVVVINGVRFVGTTLWSDFEALASSEKTLTLQLKQRDKAFRAANFYLRKNTTLVNGEPMLAEQMRELAQTCQAWLRQALAEPFEGPTVAVTHFAPTLRSADPRYGITPGTAGFCNALDDLLPHAKLWLHGHLHCFNDFVVRGRHHQDQGQGQPFECRVVANPLGYAKKDEQKDFMPTRFIDLAVP